MVFEKIHNINKISLYLYFMKYIIFIIYTSAHLIYKYMIILAKIKICYKLLTL